MKGLLFGNEFDEPLARGKERPRDGLSRMDARAKLLGFLFYLVAVSVASGKSFTPYIGFLAVLLFCLLLGRLSPWVVLGRMSPLVPFVLLVGIFLPFGGSGPAVWHERVLGIDLRATESGLRAFGHFLARATLALGALVVLGSRTPFPDLVWALRALGCPALLVMVLSLTYRYVMLLVEETGRLLRARSLRSFHPSTWLRAGGKSGSLWRGLGNILGTLFLRTHARASAIHAALLLRGFQGNWPVLRRTRFGFAEFGFVAFMGIVLAAGILVGVS